MQDEFSGAGFGGSNGPKSASVVFGRGFQEPSSRSADHRVCVNQNFSELADSAVGAPIAAFFRLEAKLTLGPLAALVVIFCAAGAETESENNSSPGPWLQLTVSWAAAASLASD